MLVEHPPMLLQLRGLLPMHVPVQRQTILKRKHILLDPPNLLLQPSIPLLSSLRVGHNLTTSLPDIQIQVANHTLNVRPQMVNIVVLDLHLT